MIKRVRTGIRLYTRTRSAIIPAEGEYFVTADHVIDDPREPHITPTGILDSRGMMLVRVTVPIKQKMGFGTFGKPADEEVETVLPEDMLAVSDIGVGIGYIEPHEMDCDDEEEDELSPADARRLVKLSDVLRSFNEQGVTVIDDRDS